MGLIIISAALTLLFYTIVCAFCFASIVILDSKKYDNASDESTVDSLLHDFIFAFPFNPYYIASTLHLHYSIIKYGGLLKYASKVKNEKDKKQKEMEHKEFMKTVSCLVSDFVYNVNYGNYKLDVLTDNKFTIGVSGFSLKIKLRYDYSLKRIVKLLSSSEELDFSKYGDVKLVRYVDGLEVQLTINEKRYLSSAIKKAISEKLTSSKGIDVKESVKTMPVDIASYYEVEINPETQEVL